jgi:hypothetical protein
MKGPWVFLLPLCVLASRSSAQRISGHARTVDGTSPIAGAVVTMTDSSGRVVSRTLTDKSGGYVLDVPVGRGVVRAIRIGYRPATAALPAATPTMDFFMERMPVMLPSVRVTSDATCTSSANGAAVLQLWDQARSALLAAIVARDANPARVSLLAFERRLQAGRRLITYQRSVVSTGSSKRVVTAARPASELAATGYRSRVGIDDVFYAPDPDVLFDDSFAATHCFGLSDQAADRPALIGLTFSPRRQRGVDRVDVEGVLWVNDIPELIRMDYRYTGVEPEATRAGNGGSMHFRTMPNGIVFIDSWVITIPRLRVTEKPAFGSSTNRDVTVEDLSEAGGFVLDAAWPDGERYTATLGAVKGRVRETKTERPIPDVTINVRGGTWAFTDSTGNYSFAVMPPGRYELAVIDSGKGGRERRQTRTVAVELGDTVVADFELDPRPAARTAVTMQLTDTSGANVANTREPSLTDFERRRRATGAAGHMIGEDELRGHEGELLSSLLLSRMSGVRLQPYKGGQYLMARTSASLGQDPLLNPRDAGSPRGCWADIWMNGTLVYKGGTALPPDVNSFSVRQLAGVEYYASDASLPQQFRSSNGFGCSTLLLWTRVR